MAKKTKKFALYFSTGIMIFAGGLKIKLCKDESKSFTHKVLLYTTDFTDDDFLIAAHRGFSSLRIENTKDAVMLANTKNYIDYIEIDLRLTKDKKLVLSHNDCLLALQNKNVKISNKNLCDLQDCDFYYPSDCLTTIEMTTDDITSEIIENRKTNLISNNYKISSLEDCINEPINKKIILDLKFQNNTDDFISELEKEISPLNIENIIFQSHDFKSLLKLKERHPEYNVSAIIKCYNDFRYIDSFDNLCVKNSLVTESLIDKVINENKGLFIWTLNNQTELNDITNKLGENYENVVYITDYPDVIATCLHEKQLKKEKTNH